MTSTTTSRTAISPAPGVRDVVFDPDRREGKGCEVIA
jgi:hypothetical protein